LNFSKGGFQPREADVLPAWLAGDSTITALIPYRRGLLPSVRVFIDHLTAELPNRVLL
jgi:hypothetical protein